jgi:hypothetical protein
MENKNIETYYKNISKPIIDNYVNNLNLKNLLALSTVNDLYIFTKKKNNKWILKDKRILLKECNLKRKKTIKEVSSTINILSKNKSIDLIKEIKIKNNTLLNKIENIDSLIDTIEKNYPTISDEYIEIYSN